MKDHLDDVRRIVYGDDFQARPVPVVHYGSPASPDYMGSVDTEKSAIRAVSRSERQKADVETNVNLRAEPNKGETCKARPSKSSGNGAGRKFVPWCKK